jgi:hypothetical protein
MKKIDPEIKQMIYELVESGLSYNEVALKLNIGKTTVYSNYHDMKKSLNNRSDNEGEVYQNDHSINHKNGIGTPDYTSNDFPSLNRPLNEIKPMRTIEGPLVELKRLLPLNYSGLAIFKSKYDIKNFVWYYSRFEILLNNSVNILTHENYGYDEKKILSLINKETYATSVICNHYNHVKNLIEKGDCEIYIIDNLKSLNISESELLELIDLNPNKSIIAITLDENIETNNYDFVARIGFKSSYDINIETKCGYIMPFKNYGEYSFFQIL